MTEHATFVNSTELQYSDTDSKGNKYTLCYSDGPYIEYEANKKNTSFPRTVSYSLFQDEKTATTLIHVTNPFEDNVTTMRFYHTPAIFTRNSPIHLGDVSKYGSNDWGNAQTMCENYAHPDLCAILDWLKNSICPAADMTMADFGYPMYE
jgi:hypothetical protein